MNERRPTAFTRTTRCRGRLLLCLALAGPAGLLPGCRPPEDAAPGGDASDLQEPPPFAMEQTATGEPLLVLTEEAREVSGLETALPRARSVAPAVEAFGSVEPDPAHQASVRAPFAGALGASGSWPRMGERVEAGRVFGVLVPRVAPLTPLETGDLEGRRAAARGEVEAAAAAVATAQKALERLRTLNAANQAASDQAVEEAAGRLAGLRAQEQAARTTLETWEHLLATPLAPLAPVPLTVPMAGEVVEVMASPGEQVEAGAELLRVSDPAVLLARVLWPGEAAPGEPPREAQVAAAGDPAQQYAATVLGPAASSSPSLAGAWLLRIELPETAALRPGTRVVATLPLPGPAVEGFELPAAALLLHAGQTWCYVEVESGRFLRRALTLQRVRDSLLVTSGLDATDRVVTRGAALLLSQELLAAGGGEP